MEHPSVKLINLKAHSEHMLYNAVLMTEMALDLRERSTTGEKYVCYLRSLAVRAARVITAMQNSGKSFLMLAQKLVISALKSLDSYPINDPGLSVLKQEFEKLLTVIERELMDVDDFETADISLNAEISSFNLPSLSEKIRFLEAKQKLSDNTFLPPSSSVRSFKPDVDEKYPESWSKESLIDLNNVMNLPPVPEDIFTSFSKPVKTSSLSSLKSLRKVKLYLQRAASSEDDEESECEDLLTLEDQSSNDSEPKNPCPFQPKKGAILGNIKELPE